MPGRYRKGRRIWRVWRWKHHLKDVADGGCVLGVRLPGRMLLAQVADDRRGTGQQRVLLAGLWQRAAQAGLDFIKTGGDLRQCMLIAGGVTDQDQLSGVIKGQ
jgi:hypothetical protein